MATTEAQARATKKYHAKFERLYVRMAPEFKRAVELHAEKMGESVNAFVQRAITQTMEKDQKK